MLQLLSFLRVKQWIKNIFVLVPLLFSQKWIDDLFGGGGVLSSSVLLGFGVFCCVSSAVYVLNDIIDIKKDRKHPVKKFRPLPSGKITIATAWIIEALLCVFSVCGMVVLNNSAAMTVLVGYFCLMLFYSLFLKHIPIVDVATISVGFLMRVWFGALIIHVPVSGFILLITLTLSLFLGFSKRQAELIRMDEKATDTRPVLMFYTRKRLSFLLYLMAILTVVEYIGYTIVSVQRLHSIGLVFSTIFVVAGFIRYLTLLNSSEFHEDPTEALLYDKTLFFCCTLYVIYVAAVLFV